MLHHLLHPLRLLWNGRAALFWPIWTVITVSASLGICLILRRLPAAGQGRVNSFESAGSRRIMALAFLAAVLSCYSAMSMVWEDFTYYDNSHFTNGTLIGRSISLQISPEGGRFWPLGHQEFNVVRYFTNSVMGYHLVRLFELLAVCGIVVGLLRAVVVEKRVALILVLLVTPSIVTCFNGLIYPEANVILWLACFLFAIDRFEREESLGWAFGTVIAAEFLLYYKETVFLFLLGFSFARIIMRWQRDAGSKQATPRRMGRATVLDIGNLCLAGIFLLYYGLVMYPKFGMSYAEGRRLPFLQVVVTYLQLDLLAWVALFITLIRVVRILQRKAKPTLLWDGMAVGAVLYFLGFIVLRMESSYYLAPVDFIAVLYVGRLAFLSLEGRGKVVQALGLAAALMIVAQDVALSAFRMYERKNVIHAKALLAQEIEKESRADSHHAPRMFFPFARPFHILEFAAYLSYTGLTIEERMTRGVTPGAQLSGSLVEKDGPCGYRTFMCHRASAPSAGDLVVIFPDDVTDATANERYREGNTVVLLSYDPRPSIPNWLRPIVEKLHVESPIFTFTPLPDSWLTASLSKWK